MLVYSLIGSLILGSVLLAINKASFRPAKTVGWAAVFFVGFGVFPVFCMMYSPVLALNALLVAVACIVCALANPSVKVVRGSVLVATFASYLIVGVQAWIELQQDGESREKYPLVSMRSRLAYEYNTPPRKLTNGDGAQLDVASMGFTTNSADHDILKFTEKKFSATLGPNSSGRFKNFSRNSALYRLHSSAVMRFINSPGFGVSRMSPYGYGPEAIEQDESPPIPQPVLPPIEPAPYPANALEGTNDLADVKPIIPSLAEPELWNAHTNSVVDFVNERNFGYYRDRNHVAGFQSHRFQLAPKLHPDDGEDSSWRIGRVELVSLLKQTEPRVYESEHLPDMEKLKHAPTRSLNGFEQAALPMLVQGKDIVIDEQPDRVRMLGSLRAGKQCLSCHEVKRGDLLGAFSYWIIRAPMQRKPEKNAPTRSVRLSIPERARTSVAVR